MPRRARVVHDLAEANTAETSSAVAAIDIAIRRRKKLQRQKTNQLYYRKQCAKKRDSSNLTKCIQIVENLTSNEPRHEQIASITPADVGATTQVEASLCPLSESSSSIRITKKESISSARKKRQHEGEHMLSSGDPKNMGSPLKKCKHCHAITWNAEKGQNRGERRERFSTCCQNGQVSLPFLHNMPDDLAKLMHSCNEDSMSKRFREHIRSFNSMFAMTSHGAKIDYGCMLGRGPYTFRMHGQNYHSIGSLLPDPGSKPRYAQLYIYDTENELTNRYNTLKRKALASDADISLDLLIIKKLQEILDANNKYVKEFRKARDWYEANSHSDFSLRLIEMRKPNQPSFAKPQASEIVALMIGDDVEEHSTRDIIVNHKANGFQCISELHPAYMPLQYPLLFPYGEDGWNKNLQHTITATNKRRKKMTLREFYSHRIQQREFEGTTLLQGGRLFQQYIVDAFASVEEERLRWIRNHQANLRAELYQGLHDAFETGDWNASTVGKRIILPSSFTGGPRYMLQNYHDAMSICSWAGVPDLFITFTCNPKWPEFEDFLKLIPGQKIPDRPDLIARLFNIKCQQLLHILIKRSIFGAVIANLHVIEFQKRGLPHTHILITLVAKDKLRTTKKIDSLISAEFPDRKANPLLFELVRTHMVHGPCGTYNPNSPCMKNGRCSKGFPMPYNEYTSINDHGYPLYRRRKSSPQAKVKNITVDSAWVVPYNAELLLEFQSYINMEVCTHAKLIKYLFKYVHKGPDSATAFIKNSATSKADEIKFYLDTRYISAAEAAWRLFDFGIHKRFPPVQRLHFHLKDEQPVYFNEYDNISRIIHDDRSQKTMFTQWFLMNAKSEFARQLLYIDFPQHFVWDKKALEWILRQRGFCIGRLPFVHPTSGDRYYLRMLLAAIPGVTSFQTLRTVDGIEYETYKAACNALGLLDDDSQWKSTIAEATLWATSHQLRILFATLLIHCEIAHPEVIWNDYWKAFSDDYQQIIDKKRPTNQIRLTDRQLQNQALIDIDQILLQNGQELSQYPGMPKPTTAQTSALKLSNDLLLEQLDYDIDLLETEAADLETFLNSQQHDIYNAVLKSCDENVGKLFFIYGGGGTGKTYLWNTLIKKLRCQQKIVLAVASSGIASLLLPGGRTAHSRFKIPIDIHEFSTCSIKYQSDLTKLIRATHLIIWDEAPMTIRYAFDAVDRTFRDLCKDSVSSAALDLPFGGKTVVLGGDFRQILPVVPKGNREAIVATSIHKSPIWQKCHLYLLTINMRVEALQSNPSLKQKTREFADWILRIGDGDMEGFTLPNTIDSTWIEIPSDMLIDEKMGLRGLVDATYANFTQTYKNADYLRARAILAPTNTEVNEINELMLDMLPGNAKTYLSHDLLISTEEQNTNSHLVYSSEFLNSICLSSLPLHSLKLKEGAPVMLLRNINQSNGLCNGTRLIISKLGTRVLEAVIITGSDTGKTVAIPRIKLFTDKADFPFIMCRTQFPVRIAFAMTINKSQGQTLTKVGIYLRNPVFSHGQLYVAISRATSKESLKFYLEPQTDIPKNYTQNIVYKEVLQSVMEQALHRTPLKSKMPEKQTIPEMEQTKEAAEHRSKKKDDVAHAGNVTESKRKAPPDTGTPPTSGSSDDDDLPLSQDTLLTKKKLATTTSRNIVQEYSSSSDDDNLTLSQVSLLRKKKLAHVTPKNTAEGRPAYLKKDEESSHNNSLKQKAKSTKQLQFYEPQNEAPAEQLRHDCPDGAATTKNPYAQYQSIIGQITHLRLRIYRWWHGKLYGEKSSVSIIFMALDPQGCKLQGYMSPYLASKWRTPIEENLLYQVSSIQVVQANKFNQLIDAHVQLQMVEQTILELLDDDSTHPQFESTPTKLSMLPTFPSGYPILQDIIAVIIDIRPPVTRTSKAKNSQIEFGEVFLTDDSIFPQCVVLTIWKDAALRYPLLSKGITNPFIVEGTGLKPNIYRGNYGFQTTTFTRLQFPKNHTKATGQMLRRMTAFKSTLTYQSIPKQMFSTQMTQTEEKLHTISDFIQLAKTAPNEAQVLSYAVRASIVHIYSEHSTTYRSCILCKKGMPNEEHDSSGCPTIGCENREGKTTYRYKIKAAIKDNSGRMDLTIFNNDAEEILQTPATTIQSMLSQDDGLSQVQELFKKAYNKVCKFIFQITSANSYFFQHGHYTAHQIQWVPRAFDNPKDLLSQTPCRARTDAGSSFAASSFK